LFIFELDFYKTNNFSDQKGRDLLRSGCIMTGLFILKHGCGSVQYIPKQALADKAYGVKGRQVAQKED
jgi:hypothetical protein